MERRLETCCPFGYKMFIILKSLQIVTSGLHARTGQCLSLICPNGDGHGTIWSSLAKHQLGCGGVRHPHTPSSDR